jgi:hypothetical protein
MQAARCRINSVSIGVFCKLRLWLVDVELKAGSNLRSPPSACLAVFENHYWYLDMQPLTFLFEKNLP